LLYGLASVHGVTGALVRLGLVADVTGVGGQRFVAIRVRFNDRCPFCWADEPPVRWQLRSRSCESCAADREQHARVILVDGARELRVHPARINLHLHTQPKSTVGRQPKDGSEVDRSTPTHPLLARTILDVQDRWHFIAK
jgi:hypothetical protein